MAGGQALPCRALAAVAVIGLCAIPRPAFAHHSVLAYDGTQGTNVSGVVIELLWRNPHVMLRIDVIRGDGEIEPWLVESGSVRLLSRLGWREDTIAAGDRVSVLGARARDGSRSLRCTRLELDGGRTLECFSSMTPE